VHGIGVIVGALLTPCIVASKEITLDAPCRSVEMAFAVTVFGCAASFIILKVHRYDRWAPRQPRSRSARPDISLHGESNRVTRDGLNWAMLARTWFCLIIPAALE